MERMEWCGLVRQTLRDTPKSAQIFSPQSAPRHGGNPSRASARPQGSASPLRALDPCPGRDSSTDRDGPGSLHPPTRRAPELCCYFKSRALRAPPGAARIKACPDDALRARAEALSRRARLPVALGAVMRLAEHRQIGEIRGAALRPGGHVVSVHLVLLPEARLV